MSGIRFSGTLDVNSNIRGSLGEVVVLSGQRRPLKPLKAAGHHFLMENFHSVPNDIDEVRGSVYSGASRKKIRTLDGIHEWHPDGRMKLRWQSGTKIDPLDREIPVYASVEFPIEIKTGPYAKLERSQREVLRYTLHNEETCPIIVQVDLSEMPDAFDMTASLYQGNPNE